MVSGSFYLLQITDLHLLAAANARLLGVDTAASLDAVLRSALSERAADALIVTGDIAHDASETTYARVRAAIESRYRGPTVWLSGNHDLAAPLERQRPDARKLELGEWQIFAIDTHVDGAEGGDVSAAELERLRGDLARTKARFVIVAGHHPPAPLGTPWLDGGSIANGAALLDILAADGRVKAYVCGHVHQETATTQRGVQRADDAVNLFSVRAAHRTLLGRRDAAGMALARSRFRRYPHDPRGSRDRLCGDPRPLGIQETLNAGRGEGLMAELKYSAESIQVLSGLEPVRKRPGMYTDTSRPNHLVQEVVDNSVDEALAGHAHEIRVSLFEDGSIDVIDDGRGMPVDMHPEFKLSGVELILTRLHSGGKFDNNTYAFSGGLHGVGVSVVNALSSWLEVEVRRDGAVHHQRYQNGAPVTKLKVIDSVGNATPARGSTFCRIPSTSIRRRSRSRV